MPGPGPQDRLGPQITILASMAPAGGVDGTYHFIDDNIWDVRVIDPKILQRARIFVDDIRQCRTDGEINLPLRTGLITESDIAGEIGEVITGRKAGRTSDDEITLFDSTGIALQDSATVPLEYERAVAAGVGVEKKMIST